MNKKSRYQMQALDSKTMDKDKKMYRAVIEKIMKKEKCKNARSVSNKNKPTTRKDMENNIMDSIFLLNGIMDAVDYNKLIDFEMGKKTYSDLIKIVSQLFNILKVIK